MPGRVSATAAVVERLSAPRVVVDRATAAAFVDLFLPALATNPQAYQKGAMYMQVAKGDVRRWVALQKRVDVRELVAAHLAAGEADAPQATTAGRLRAIGAQFGSGDLVRVLNVDLDGGVEPVPVVRELRRLLGSASTLVVSGSGLSGRYRVLVRIVDTPVEQARELATRLLASIGVPVAPGKAEIYPSTKNGRLPFGMGGCTVFVDEALQASERRCPWELVEHLLEAPRVDLRKVLEQQLELQPVATQKEPEKQQASKGRRVRAVDPVVRNVRHADLLHNGASPGARDAEVFIAYRLLYTQALSMSSSEKHARALAKRNAREWVQSVGIARTQRAKEHRGLERELQDVDRKLDAIRYPMARPAPRHLTAPEIERVVALADATPGVDRAALVALLLRVLPVFKAAAVAGMPARYHRDEWAKHAGGARYAVLRQASGLFVQVAPHRSKALMRKLGRPESDATAKTWACTFTFDAVAPARAEFGVPHTKSDADIYRAARLTAERVRRLQARTSRKDSGIRSPSEHTRPLPVIPQALPPHPYPACAVRVVSLLHSNAPKHDGPRSKVGDPGEDASKAPGSDFTFLRRSPGSW